MANNPNKCNNSSSSDTSPCHRGAGTFSLLWHRSWQDNTVKKEEPAVTQFEDRVCHACRRNLRWLAPVHPIRKQKQMNEPPPLPFLLSLLVLNPSLWDDDAHIRVFPPQ